MVKKKKYRNAKFTVNTYNTLTGGYENVEVTFEVYNSFRRTQWNMDKNDKRHRYYSILFADIKCPKGMDIHDFSEFSSDEHNPEKIMFDRQEKSFDRVNEILDKCVTKIQKRRFILHHFRDMTTREIAVFEGTSQRSVMESIQSATKKLKKYLRNF